MHTILEQIPLLSFSYISIN